mmetsp:Transcript_79573/g.233965  ORF Transcript_79573/g.233965 Transcript_79573/m.233965 type:complete len:459 (-) Transcript_79573:101-1477(-)
MEYLLDYTRCAAFIFFLSFKPSEPHLTRYLRTVKHLTADEVNNSVYPVYTYTSLVMVVILATLKVAGFVRLRRCRHLTDKALILLGCAGRVATRLLLLFGDSLAAMQLMQVTFSLGIITEIVFYAYCLKVVPPQQSQRLAAITQASYLLAHTAAGVLGDCLLRWTDIGLTGLMWISACSVMTAALIACSLRGVDPEVSLDVVRPACVLRAVYGVRYFSLSALWWALNYPVYMTVYGYESSVYSEYIKGPDHNGTIFAVGLLAGSACALLLSSKSIELAASRRLLPTLVTLGAVMAIATGLMGWAPDREWLLGLSFTVFFMAWSFANTLFYGETRRAVDGAALHPALSSLVSFRDTGTRNMVSEALGTRLVSTVFIVNSAAGTLVNGLLAAVLFTWLQLDVSLAFSQLAIGQALVAVVVLGLAGLGRARGTSPLRSDGHSLQLYPAADSCAGTRASYVD